MTIKAPNKHLTIPPERDKLTYYCKMNSFAHCKELCPVKISLTLIINLLGELLMYRRLYNPLVWLFLTISCSTSIRAEVNAQYIRLTDYVNQHPEQIKDNG